MSDIIEFAGNVFIAFVCSLVVWLCFGFGVAIKDYIFMKGKK
jgi:hypothetical protein